jgi:hypothetical protein
MGQGRTRDFNAAHGVLDQDVDEGNMRRLHGRYPRAVGTDATLARFGAMATGYESYFLTVAAPEGGRGFWLRYTVRVARGRVSIGSLWFTWFDAAGPTATKHGAPEPLTGNGRWIEIAGAQLGVGRACGSIESEKGRPRVSWDLTFGGEPALAHLPQPWMYAARVPRTKPLSIHPFARFDGTVVIGDEPTLVGGWPGMVGHNWGVEHTERWIWLHGMAFRDEPDDTWIDVVLGRVKVGGWVAPWVAGGALSLHGEQHRLGGMGRTGSTMVAESAQGAQLTLPGARGLEVHVEIGAPKQRFVGWTYGDADGQSHDVVNCSIADLEVTVSRPGLADLELIATGTAAYELGMREHDHGITMQPFADVAPAHS